jgi:hypothetical protein
VTNGWEAGCHKTAFKKKQFNSATAAWNSHSNQYYQKQHSYNCMDANQKDKEKNLGKSSERGKHFPIKRGPVRTELPEGAR